MGFKCPKLLEFTFHAKKKNDAIFFSSSLKLKPVYCIPRKINRRKKKNTGKKKKKLIKKKKTKKQPQTRRWPIKKKKKKKKRRRIAWEMKKKKKSQLFSADKNFNFLYWKVVRFIFISTKILFDFKRKTSAAVYNARTNKLKRVPKEGGDKVWKEGNK